MIACGWLEQIAACKEADARRALAYRQLLQEATAARPRRPALWHRLADWCRRQMRRATGRPQRPGATPVDTLTVEHAPKPVPLGSLPA
jgi:hypothetical protein